MPHTNYGRDLPHLDLNELGGIFLVVEGPDAVGRSTQIDLLARWLEDHGEAVMRTGLNRSMLASKEIERAKHSNRLRPRATAYLYAADLFDQLEHTIIPALRAGMVVIADRYVPSLIARSDLREVPRTTMRRVYDAAIQPDLIFNLRAKPELLVERMLHKINELDYFESGMDLGLSKDWFESFHLYQKRLDRSLASLQEHYPMQEVDANGAIWTIQKDLQKHVAKVVKQLRNRTIKVQTFDEIRRRV